VIAPPPVRRWSHPRSEAGALADEQISSDGNQGRITPDTSAMHRS